jgi:hypothetical protein
VVGFGRAVVEYKCWGEEVLYSGEWEREWGWGCWAEALETGELGCELWCCWHGGGRQVSFSCECGWRRWRWWWWVAV